MSAPELQQEGIAISLSEPWWKHVRDAIRGVPHDYTEGSIGRSLMLLAVPMVLETLMESLFAVVDVFFVGKLRNSFHDVIYSKDIRPETH